MIYVVLGMHKSGTTLLSRILHASGINMGEFNEEKTYDQGNQYERDATGEINKILLQCGDAHSLDVLSLVDTLPHTDRTHDKITALINNLNDSYPDWGFKDPRTCLTFPIWQPHLFTYKLIFVYRPPIEVWHHYRKYIPAYKIVQRISQGYRALKAWHVYNNRLLELMKTSNQEYSVINFGVFMQESSSLEDLATVVGRPLTDCRDQELYRSKSDRDFIYKICAAFVSRKLKPHVEILFANLEKERKSYRARRQISKQENDG